MANGLNDHWWNQNQVQIAAEAEFRLLAARLFAEEDAAYMAMARVGISEDEARKALDRPADPDDDFLRSLGIQP